MKALSTNEPPPAAGTEQLWRKQVAVAAILVEASEVDRAATEDERTAIVRAIRRCFKMNETDAVRLVEAARVQFAGSLDDWMYAEAVRLGFDYEQRIEIVGLLWEVVYADDKLTSLEMELLRRIAAQLDLDADDLNAARVEAFGRASSARPGAERPD